jgi:cyclopropane-fatty-acyl-phospholipid synthase
VSSAITGRAGAGASREAIEHHYDVGAEFFEQWLDATLTYSCAMWQPGDDLAGAQLRKLDWHIDGARAAHTGRLLDIGCGWGSLMRRALERGTGRAVGLTLSPEQQRHIARRRDPRIEVHLRGWESFHDEARFDAITSVGAFEHFARLGLTRAQKVAAYAAFFDRCHALLRPGAFMTLQTIAKGEVALDARGLRDFSYIAREMFPQSDLPHPADVLAAVEGRFEGVLMRNDRADYARTCAAWLTRLEGNRQAIERVVGSETLAAHARYLAACVRQFDAGHACLLRLILRRVEPRRTLRLGGAR